MESRHIRPDTVGPRDDVLHYFQMLQEHIYTIERRQQEHKEHMCRMEKAFQQLKTDLRVSYIQVTCHNMCMTLYAVDHL